MAREKTISLERAAGERTIHCHLMPCRIEYDGATVKAREYFWPTIRALKLEEQGEAGSSSRDKKRATGERAAENQILTASFRGRPLQGQKIRLPKDYEGHVLRGDASASKSVGNFAEFTYWNWDELPSDEDHIVKALQWINVSKALHGNE